MRYTEQKEFSFNKLQELRAIVPDAGTSVTVEFFNGVNWSEDSESPITGPNKIFCKHLKVRLTPDVGGFFFDEEQYL